MLLAHINIGRTHGQFTALMLVQGVGLLAEQCAGVKCAHGESFSLESFQDPNKVSLTPKECSSHWDKCYNYTLSIPGIADNLWGCVSKEVSDCLRHKTAAGLNCYVMNEPRISDDDREIGECLDLFLKKKAEGRSNGEAIAKVRLCLCKSDLCNGNPKSVAPVEKTETTTVREVVTVTEGGKTETTTVGTEVPETTEATSRRPKKRRHSVPKEARFVMYFGIVLVVLFAVASCYLLLCLDRKCKCGRKKY